GWSRSTRSSTGWTRADAPSARLLSYTTAPSSGSQSSSSSPERSRQISPTNPPRIARNPSVIATAPGIGSMSGLKKSTNPPITDSTASTEASETRGSGGGGGGT